MVKENGMVMMTEQELNRMNKEKDELVKDYEKRLELMQEAIRQLMTEGATSEDVRVGKIDFLAIYHKALDEMFDIMDNVTDERTPDDIPNDIYGHDVTVHWHGIYCNCGDGATASNYIISAVEEMLDEDDNEW